MRIELIPPRIPEDRGATGQIRDPLLQLSGSHVPSIRPWQALCHLLSTLGDASAPGGERHEKVTSIRIRPTLPSALWNFRPSTQTRSFAAANLMVSTVSRLQQLQG
jgi:hypothetical protein